MACCLFTNVSTAEVGVMQRCGKFNRLVEVLLFPPQLICLCFQTNNTENRINRVK